MKAVVFARISSVNQEDGCSLDAQEEKVLQYCKNNGFKVIKVFKIVESSTIRKRKQFNEAINLIKKQKETTALIAHSTDRLLRSFRDFGTIEDLIKFGKMEVHLVNEHMVLTKNSPAVDLAQFQFRVLGSNMYVNQTRDHVIKAIDYKVSHGLVIGNVPTGYLNARDPDTGNATVIIDNERALMMKRIFQDYSTGLYSVRELSEKAKKWGLTSPRNPTKPLSSKAIANLLSNPFYYGKRRYKDKLLPHIYPPLIDEELFDRCQQVMNNNRVTPVVSTNKPFIFRGLIICKSCGCQICSDIKKGKYIYLFCTKAKGKQICNSGRIREEVALGVVEDVLERLHIPEQLLEAIRKNLEELHNAGCQDYKKATQSMRQESAIQENSKQRLMDLYLRGSITDKEFDKKKAEIEKKIERLNKQILAAQSGHKEFEISLIALLKVVSKAGNIFKSSKIDQKRQILKFLFSNLWLDGKEIHYELNKPFDKLLDLNKREEWWAIGDSNTGPHPYQAGA